VTGQPKSVRPHGCTAQRGGQGVRRSRMGPGTQGFACGLAAPRWLAPLLLDLALGPGARGQSPSPAEPQVRFRVVDVFVDSVNRPLAAYQLVFEAHGSDVKIVGVEGGESDAFREPPHHDPRAIQKERVILAAFHTGASLALPKGRTRVATIHVQVQGATEPDYEVRLVTAATVKARKIQATVHAEERKTP